MNTKLMWVIVAVLVVGGGIYYYTQSDQYAAKYGKVVSVENGPSGEEIVRKTAPERKPEGQTNPAESGWSHYINSEWKITFEYPSNWKISEEDSDVVTKDGQYFYGGELQSIKASGDGYIVHFHNIGRGYPADQSTIAEYTVDGKKVRVLEDKFGDTYMQAMSACGVSLEISRPSESKEITDKVIASIRCSAE